MANRDTWLQLRQAQRTQKLNKYIALPTFSFICGRPRACLNINAYTLNASAQFLTNNGGDFAFAGNGYTFSAWIKPSAVTSIDTVCMSTELLSGAFDFYIGIGKGDGNFYTVGIPDNFTGVTTGVQADYTQWQQIAISRITNGPTTTVKFYYNGVLRYTSSNNHPATNGTITMFVLGGTRADGNLFNGKYDEGQLWFPAQADEDILQRYNRIVGLGYSALKQVYHISEQSGLVLTPSMQTPDAAAKCTLNGTTQTLDITNNAPLLFGASFICALFPITVSKKFSFVFPVIPPTTVNHALCVSWTDDNGVFQRRKLYGSKIGVEDIAPNPPNYAGEVIATTANLEVWNVDGNYTADLTSSLKLYVSNNTLPVNELDHVNTILQSVVGNSNIYATFPWANAGPSFNQALSLT